jgi:subtilisin-like proprotein convertase family protein
VKTSLGVAALAAAVLVSGCHGSGGPVSASTFPVGGTVSGVTGSGLVLQLNGAENLSVAADGSFTFTTQVASGSTYNVTVLGYPSAPTEACAVSNGSGTISAPVTNVSVACVPGYLVGGTVTGLTGDGMVLRNNGVASQPISVSGGFTFNAPVVQGSAYAVTVFAPPTGQHCTVTNGSGTSSTDVSNVAVSCSLGFSVATEADPLVLQQWHLKNTGQNAFSDNVGIAGFDINVDPVYSAFGYEGVGVITAVVDTGLEIAHEDLSVNVVPGGSYNFNTGSNDPTSTATDGDHGTAVAGLIAMARNSTGGIGVAPAAKLKGFNLLSSPTQSSSQLVASLGGSSANPASNDAAIFNESFGVTVTDGNQHIDPTVLAQLQSGVNTLRGGKGALYVKAGGNGFVDMGLPIPNCAIPNSKGLSCENVNFDPENATPYQIMVGAILATGVKASYSTAGSALWLVAPGGGGGFNNSVAPGFVAEAYQPAMVTTDQSGCTKGFSVTNSMESLFNNGAAPNSNCNYTNTMNGSSSAAPVTSGVIALMLEANPALTWRDVKHILASTATQIDAARAAVTVAVSNGSYVAEPAWTRNNNNTGFFFHNWYGFGLVNANAAVTMARTYTAGAFGALADTGTLSSGALNQAIPDNSTTGAGSAITVGATPAFVEAVQISITATHGFPGDLAIELTSPKGTRSVLKTGDDGLVGVDSNGAPAPNLNGMVFVSNAFYGENPAGLWSLRVVDIAPQDVGTLTSWTLRIYGH